MLNLNENFVVEVDIITIKFNLLAQYSFYEFDTEEPLLDFLHGWSVPCNTEKEHESI